MQRREFLTAATAAGLAAATQATNADVLIPNRRNNNQSYPQGDYYVSRYPSDDLNRRRDTDFQRYILLEIYYPQTIQKRNDLLVAFDRDLISRRNRLGFDRVGVFYVDIDLMKDDRGYNANLYDSAVFVVQETNYLENFVDLQPRSSAMGMRFNLSDDLEYIDEEMNVLRSLVCQPRISVPYSNSNRILQLRTYNSPNYERNLAKARMFEQGELNLFRRCGMEPVFMGNAIFGTWIPNITYMLSFENDDARRAGWDAFVRHPEWRQMSSDPQYARTATRIRNLFLRPSHGSQI